MGLVEPGTAFFQYGSSMFYYYCTDHFVGSYVSPQGNGALKGGKAFTVPGTYCLGDGTNAAGVTCCTAKSWTPKSRAAKTPTQSWRGRRLLCRRAATD